MTKTLSRKDAMELLATFELTQKDRKWRNEELYVIASEDWEDDDHWCALPEPLRQEVRRHGQYDPEIKDPEHRRFDKVLMLSMRNQYIGSTNEFIGQALEKASYGNCEVIGKVEVLVACPCCGLRTLANRGDYDICPVCWWEDNGQDNQHSTEYSGLNRCSLKQGRINYIQTGIFDPNRGDLRTIQSPAEQYVREREFVITDGTILEIGANWSEPL